MSQIINYDKMSDQELFQQLKKLNVYKKGLEGRLKERKLQHDIKLGIKEINDKVWPFFFPTDLVKVEPNRTESANVEITNEAGFIITKVSKVVYRFDGDDPVYIDPNDDASTGLLAGLSFRMKNSSSTRSWMDKAVHLNMIGDGSIPYKLDKTFFMTPNQNMNFEVSNKSQETYLVGFCLHGIRFKDALIDSLPSMVIE